MFKKMLFVLSVILLLSSVSFADQNNVSVGTNMGGPVWGSGAFANGASFGFLSYGGTQTAVVKWNPDFSYNGLSLGLDVNIPLNNNNQASISNLVLRYLEYKNQTWGARYGIVNNYTIGAGLLVNNYSSNAQGSLVQTGKQNGLTGYYNFGMYSVQYLATMTSLYSIRLAEQIDPRFIVEEYYVTDFDGVTFVRPDGTTVQYPSQSGFGADATYGLWGNAKLYAEFARMNNHGNALTAGFGDDEDFGMVKAGLKAERKLVDKNFVPGYFNQDYEIDPIDIASYESLSTNKDGYAITGYMNVMDKAKATAQLESYNNSNPALKAEISGSQDPYTFYGALFQPNFVDARSLDASQGAIILGKVGYKVNPMTTIILNYKKAYDAVLGKVVESQWYEVGLSF